MVVAVSRVARTHQADVQRMHQLMVKLRSRDQLTREDHDLIVRTVSRQTSDIVLHRVGQYARDVLVPLTQPSPEALVETDSESLATLQAYEVHPLIGGVAQVSPVLTPGPNQMGVILPWAKATPVTTQPTDPPSDYVASVIAADNTPGAISIGVAAGERHGRVYPAPENYLLFRGASVVASLPAVWWFGAMSPAPIRVDVTVDMQLPTGRNPLVLEPGGRYSVAAAVANATLTVGGMTPNGPAVFRFTKRFIERALRGDGVTKGHVDSSVQLGGSLALAPGATYIALGIQIDVTALIASGTGPGFSAIDLAQYGTPPLIEAAPQCGPIVVGQPRMMVTFPG